MNCVPLWRPRGRPSLATDARRYPAWVAVLALLVGSTLVSGCAGLFQRSAPARIATYSRVATGQFAAGFAEADITPTGVQYLAGFNLARESTGVHSPLKARVAVLVVGGRRIAIVGIDSLGLLREDVDWIKAGLTGFANGDVFLCASHTHAAPDLVGLWGYYFLTSGRDLAYLEQVRAAIVAAVLEASRAVQPATLAWGESRLPPRDVVKNSNRSGVFNRRATVLRVRRATDGHPLGAVLHFACHPEMMRRSNTEVSADLVGELCDRWRQAGHGQAVFVNGELGAMVTPGFRQRGAEGMGRAGSELLAVCERALAAARPVDASEAEVRRRDVYLPLQSPGLVFGRLTGSIRRELYDGRMRTSVGYLRLGGFEAVAVPGEMEPVLAEEIRRSLRRPRLVFFGLADDEVGYLMRERDAADPEFAYERTMSPGRRAGELVREAIAGLHQD